MGLQMNGRMFECALYLIRNSLGFKMYVDTSLVEYWYIGIKLLCS